MKKPRIRIGIPVLAVSAIVLFAGCEAFLPEASISKFTSNVTSTYVGETVYFSVSGSTTQGGNYSAFQDYSGTLTISGDIAAPVVMTMDEDMSFTDIPVTFNVAGTAEVLATLETSTGETATSLRTITVDAARANEGTSDNPVRLVFGGSARTSKVGRSANGQTVSYYRFVPASSAIELSVSNLSPFEDLDYYIYTNPSFSTLAYSTTASGVTVASWFLSGLTPSDPYYLRIVNADGFENTTFNLQVKSQ